jgi:synaptojanin
MATDNTKRLVWEELIIKTLNSQASSKYILLKSEQLVGAALCIFIKADHAQYIRNVQGSIKKTGLAGLAGNKGGVAISVDFYDTSLCFVCSHLAAGQSNVADRNNDYHTINDGLILGKGKKIYDHDSIVWFGDFNYRIDLPNEQVRSLVAQGNYKALYERDQVQFQIRQILTF